MQPTLLGKLSMRQFLEILDTVTPETQSTIMGLQFSEIIAELCPPMLSKSEFEAFKALALANRHFW